MTEEKRKKPNIFSRAFKSLKDDYKNIIALEKELDGFINKVMDGEITVESKHQITDIGDKNGIDDKSRTINYFTSRLNEKFKEVFKEYVQDDVFVKESVFYPISNLQSLIQYTNESKFNKEILTKLSLYSRNSSLLYDSLDNLARNVTSINLQKNEVCLLDDQAAVWKEQKTKTKRVNYGGIGVSVKVVKGVYIRTGTMNVQPVKESFLEVKIKGELIVTNKRIVVDAGNDIKVIKFNDILKVVPYNDAIAIHKGTANPAILYTEMNHAALATFINRIIESEK
ncbi:hypothetical protein [Macrococcoides canis]|uniref:hypothetical protein n=1 Tax=Macrococcoides canis TaxID=1855823 RepID=UPI00165D85B8|nr:hypothetical protein [Macrococcus canis]QNR07760.1 hypothetical protein GL258_05655 [Macrococcus canis]